MTFSSSTYGLPRITPPATTEPLEMHVRDFSPAPAFQGGCLIALAALVFLVMANKRTGISGEPCHPP